MSADDERGSASEAPSNGVPANGYDLLSPEGAETYEPEEASPELTRVLAEYQSSLKAISAIPEFVMKRSALERYIAAQEPEMAAWWIDQLIRGALWGHSAELEAILACSSWLIENEREDRYHTIQSLFEAAHLAERHPVIYMLRSAPPHQALPEGKRLPEVRLPTDRDTTLGKRRHMAALNDQRMLERLMLDPSPLVIEKLISNPRIRLSDVLLVATRRPNTVELQMTLLQHPRWFCEIDVRRAVVQNPFSPTGPVLKLLPTLRFDDLKKLRFAGDLHPAVAEAASIYVDLRERRTAPWGV